MLLARVAGVDLGWAPPVVLAISVWLAYAADRWIEGWRLDEDVIRTPRHHFYKEYRWPVAALWIAALAADVAIAFARLDARDIAAGFLLIAAVAGRTCSRISSCTAIARGVRRRNCASRRSFRPAPSWFVTETPQPGALMLPLAFFALLCFTNCALISVWEREVDRAHGQTSLALGASDHERLIRQLPLMIAGGRGRRGDSVRRRRARCRDLGRGQRRAARARRSIRTPCRAPACTRARGCRADDARRCANLPRMTANFDSLARWYHTLELSTFGVKLESARFAHIKALSDCRDILLLGDGDGRFLKRLLKIAPNARIRSIDASAEMLRLAASRVAPADQSRVTFECTDALTAELADICVRRRRHDLLS
jgi:hypothetical protein